MTVAFVPVYIKYLGIENYGLIGLFSVLQAFLSLLDLGLKPALGREMARYAGGASDDQSIWNLLRSIELLSAVGVFSVASIIWAASGWLATDWVRAQGLPGNAVAQAFSVMGVVACLQFLESIYASSLAGLQRQALQNILMSITATVRGVGAVGVLVYIAPSTQYFFLWQGICSVGSLILLRAVVYKLLPVPINPPRFSKAALLTIWRFAAGMLSITLLALLLTQIDKILLSRLLSLENFGYYVLAGLVAGSLGVLVGPISAAFYPKFVELLVRHDETALRLAYHQGAQLVTVIVGSATLVLIVFRKEVLFLWTSDIELTQHVAPLMCILALGTFFNCLMWIPYQLQLAAGWTSLTISMNAIAVVLFAPLTLWLVPKYGAMSAAWIWVAINWTYCVIGVQFMFRRMLTTEKWIWYFTDVLIPFSAAGAITILARQVFPLQLTRISASLWLGFTAFAVLLASAVAAPLLRRHLLRYLPRVRRFFV